ncbi:MAG: Molybdenum cofactor guanylyltransferase [Firmicutes bacterium]|nr:Molybdenum cofactor guanylyltransferase [Bacillota bacterium]
MNAIILAGGDKEDGFARRHGVANKALIPINDQAMLDYVFRALSGSRLIETITLVGPATVCAPYASARVAVQPDTGDMMKNCLAAMAFLPQDEKVVVATSDIPMLTTAVVDDYLASLAEKKGDFFYPIISREVNEKLYPGVKRTYATLGGRTYTGGNLLVIDPKVAVELARRLERFIAHRKNILALSAMIGYRFLVKLLMGQLTLPEVEERMSQLLACHCVAVECPYAEIGTDVDKDSDLALARRVLSGA